MNRRSLTLLAVLVVVAAGWMVRGADEPRSPESQAVRELLDRQVLDWNRGDLDGFCGGYWKSDEVVFQSGPTRTNGWQAMRDRYQKSYKSEGKAMGKLAFEGVEVQILAPDVALARGRWKLSGLPADKPLQGLFTLILRKFPAPQGWKIVHDHTSA